MQSKGLQVKNRNKGTGDCSPEKKTGYPQRPGKSNPRGGANVVVGERESRLHGKGQQRTDTHLMAEKQSMDLDYQAATPWVLSVQRKLYQWSKAHSKEAYRDLWNFVIDVRNLTAAWKKVASNKGKRTPGIDGMTVGGIRKMGELRFLDDLRNELKAGTYRPTPSRRKQIPKPGKPGKFRYLGIPTVKDRIVQCAIKQMLEPIVEPRFMRVSYGFRPGRCSQGALEHLRLTIHPRKKNIDGKSHDMPYQWIIEGDIQACFDNIDHHLLMNRVRKHVADKKVNQLLVRFLDAGILAEDQFIRTTSGTPQGGLVSPLLANIALSVIEERYERWIQHQDKVKNDCTTDGIKAADSCRYRDRTAGKMVCFTIRYADDFITMVAGSKEEALNEKNEIERMLKEKIGLTLSPEKTKITDVKEGFHFLGFKAQIRWSPRGGWVARIEIPKQKILDFKYRIKQLTKRNNLLWSLTKMIRKLNPILRGWGNYYSNCIGAKKIFDSMDWYIRDRLWRWLCKKYPKANAHQMYRFIKPSSLRPQYKVIKTDNIELYCMAWKPVKRYRLAWMRPALFTKALGEPDA